MSAQLLVSLWIKCCDSGVLLNGRGRRNGRKTVTSGQLIAVESRGIEDIKWHMRSCFQFDSKEHGRLSSGIPGKGNIVPVSLPMKTQETQLRMIHDHSPDDVVEGVAMVKTELRKTIQSRREAKGLGSVELCDQEEQKNTELSAEEIEKVNVRRERNRLSAQKCRKRRREQLVYLSQEATTVEEANNLLENEIGYLKMEKEQLSRMLREHSCNMTRETCQSKSSGASEHTSTHS